MLNRTRYKNINIVLSTLILSVLFVTGVNAQAQDDINPDFNLSSEEDIFIQLNYDCSGVPWPEEAISVYRRFNPTSGKIDNYFILRRETIVELESKDSFDPANLLPVPYLLEHPTGEKEIVCEHEGNQYKAVSVPPTLQQLENYFLDGVYIFWAFIGIYAVFRVIALGLEYMTNATSHERLGNIKSKLYNWLLGVVLAGLAVPLLHFIYGIIGVQSTDCYYRESNGEVEYDLTLPGFTFFFKDVCTDGEELGVPPAANPSVPKGTTK